MFSDLDMTEDIDIKKIDIKILKHLPEDFALKNKVLPYKTLEDILYIAAKSSEDKELVSRLKLMCKINIKLVKWNEKILSSRVEEAYDYLNFIKAVEILMDKVTDDEKQVQQKESKDRDKDKEAPAVILVEYLINNAIKNRASDIHIEAEQERVRIRYRIDGNLVEISEIPLEIYSNVTTRIKVLSNMDISERRIPQDGKHQYCYKGKLLDLRISSIPTIFGEKFVIRILDKNIDYCDINKIYKNLGQKALIMKILKRSSGIILATGPTGSGKSTTLYAMLNELNRKNINITSIENPVEYTMNGINQIDVNVKSGISFAAGLRSILRQDPDVIMIGEIRDEETASIAIRAAITGHLVLSTLHTNDAVGTINRLAEMGIERYLLADALVAVISQRLVGMVCKSCKKTYVPSQVEQDLFQITEATLLCKGEGCYVCNYSGYYGRTAVSEILMIDDDWKKDIMKGKWSHYRNNSVNTSNLVKQCKDFVLGGITTTEELMRVSNGEI